MTIQAIINTSQSIEIDRRRLVGQTISRSQRLRTQERASAVAFRIRVTPIGRFRYSEYRDVIESLMIADRNQETEIRLSGTQGLNYLTQYQGSLNAAQLAALTITNFTGTSVTISGLPSISSSTYIFRAGDYIQPSLSRYPYVVSTDVQRGSGSLVTATVHRSLITSEQTTITGTLLVGTATTMRLVITEFPQYRIIQRDWAEFSGDFSFVERII